MRSKTEKKVLELVSIIDFANKLLIETNSTLKRLQERDSDILLHNDLKSILDAEAKLQNLIIDAAKF